MRKRIFGRRFKRDINQRRALFKSLMRELVIHGRIKTTEAKAKSIKGQIEKFVTKAKIQGEESRVHLQKHFTQDVVTRIITEIAPVFKDRPGGYTRIMRLGNRVKDNAPMVMIEWVDMIAPSTIVMPEKKKSTVAKKGTGKSTKKEAEAKAEKPAKKQVKSETKKKAVKAKK